MKVLISTATALLCISLPLHAQNAVKDAPATDKAQLNAAQDLEQQYAAALKKAGNNAKELKKAMKLVPVDQRKGMKFLIAYMPDKDLKTLKADFLVENAKWAYKARRTFAWAKDVPEEIFFNDVLPYASLNERRDDWRKDFYDRFSKHVKNAETMEEAITLLNAAIKEEVKVIYSTKRKKADQSPYESMDQGLASCSGLSILLTDAFRSVGIPSRVAGIPMWTTKRGNHNWVEVYTTSDKQWHFTEYYPDSKGLDHGWLLADAAQANPKSLYHSIYASSWKPADSHFPLVWNMRTKEVHAYNVTQRYIKLGGGDKKGAENMCEIRVDFYDGNKRAAIPVAIVQGDTKIAEGLTPKATDDMNNFFTAKVKQGQIYQIAWKLPNETKWRSKQVQPTKKDKWLKETIKK